MEHHDAYTPSEIPPTSSVGARLKAARETQGLGLGEVADRLKLSLRQLEAIESDHFSALPGATFVRGFVRNYARFLEIDPVPLMHDLEAQFPSSVRDVANLTKSESAHPQEEKPAVQEAQPMVRGNHKGAWLGFALVGVVVAGLAWWMVDGSMQRQDAAPEQQEGQLAPMLTEASAALPASSPAVAAAPASAPVAVVPAPQASAPAVSAKPAQASAPAAVAAPAPLAKPAASAPASAAGAGSVRLLTKGDSWVSVTDADGNKLLYQLLNDGTEKTVSGKAPLKVVLGNANQVQLYFNGQPVDFTSKIQGATAKIELK